MHRRLPPPFLSRVLFNHIDMFLNLYRGTQTYTWYDICAEGTDPDTGEYFPGEGEETTVFYQWALFPSVLQQDDGGQYSRKDGEFRNTVVDRVDSLPQNVELRAANSIGTLLGDVRLWLDWNASWLQFLYRPRRYWVPCRFLGWGPTNSFRSLVRWLKSQRFSISRTGIGMWIRTIAYHLNAAIHLRGTLNEDEDGEFTLIGDFNVPFGWDLHLTRWQPLWHKGFIFFRPVRTR